MRGVVIGGSDQIGGWLLDILARRGHEGLGTYASVPTPGLTPLDAGRMEEAAAWLRGQRPDVVFYPAGFTWVDGCERDPARARSANVEQPMNLARAAAEAGARFVYFSTDYVFDGTTGPYGEDDPTNPLSAYGRAKREAEMALSEELGERQLTVRTAWVFGPERQGKNFAYQLARTLAARKPLICPNDQISSPSYAPDVALAVVQLAEAGRSGLIHVAGPQVIDRVLFAQALADGLGLDPSGISGRPTAELNQEAARPLRGGLRIERLEELLPGSMRPLVDAVADFRERLRTDDRWARLW